VAHAARAEELTSEGGRRKLARRLDTLVERAENPRPATVIPLVPPCREQLRDAMALILEIRSRLLSGDPLAPAGSRA
jgi:hypothetical protein